MKLSIENIGKLNKADIELNGITVIAGENNTGKSTVGKVLFSMTDVLFQFNDYVESSVKGALRKNIYEYGEQLQLLCKEYLDDNTKFVKNTSIIDKLQQECIENLYKSYMGKKEADIQKYVKKYTIDYAKVYQCDVDKCLKDASGRSKKLQERLLDLWKIPENELGKQRATNSFSNVFYYQINKLQNLGQKGKAELVDDYGKGSKLEFEENKCIKFDYKTHIGEKAYFIESSRCLDDVNKEPDFLFAIIANKEKELVRNKKNLDKVYLRNALCPGGCYSNDLELLNMIKEVKEKENNAINELEVTIMQQKYDKILKLIKDAIPGGWGYKNGKMYFVEGEGENVIALPNLSTGLKSMLLIERMISLGLLTTDSILILDEPEINLHPEWQLLYARIIVIMQKALDIKILLTTHSPYFLKAIKSYALQEKVMDKCKFYLAENIDGNSEITDFTENTNVLFRTLAEPLRKLKQMEYEEEE